MKTLLSIFDYSGNWSYPYAEAGWNVIRIDRKLTFGDGVFDISTPVEELCADWFYENIFDLVETVDGILAAVPCTDFCSSGAWTWKEKDKTINTLFGEFNRTEYFVNLVYQVLRCVDLCKPDFFALENPVGRIAKLVPELGKPWYFQPYYYGDAYSKKTALFGNFNRFEPTKIVEPVKGKHGSITQSLGGKSERTKEIRSTTPLGFAYAFYEANH